MSKKIILENTIGYMNLVRTEDIGRAMWPVTWTQEMKDSVLAYAERHNLKIVGMEAEIEALGFPKGSIILSYSGNPDALQEHPNKGLVIKAIDHSRAIKRISNMKDMLIISPSTIFKCMDDVIVPVIKTKFIDVDDATRVSIRRSGAINIKDMGEYRRNRQVTNPENVVKSTDWTYSPKVEKPTKSKPQVKHITLFDD
ncbi:DNA gyrase subunit A [Vibrio phage VAP7]|uniref:DNA gyrase subunit A n=1 Tax=Vibrio phage VAP7 TaxID=2584487 RepID=A0A4Y5TX29_9CAUD|nr:DNA gyrase subunit A [Vibrio phage VAP7]QDB73196.1 DNA gyrase subunit A [Vibrio phage VAP7]UFD98119.1 hypothetical protein [Vibrio phage BX-1]